MYHVRLVRLICSLVRSSSGVVFVNVLAVRYPQEVPRDPAVRQACITSCSSKQAGQLERTGRGGAQLIRLQLSVSVQTLGHVHL